MNSYSVKTLECHTSMPIKLQSNKYTTKVENQDKVPYRIDKIIILLKNYSLHESKEGTITSDLFHIHWN